MNLEQKIEAILFFKNEPVTLSELSKILDASKEDVQDSIAKLQQDYKDRGMVIVTSGEQVSFGTSPEASSLIESMQKEEISRDLGRAGLETLSIILYKGPIARREIDHIRGVNSGYILRNLLIRGLIERTDPVEQQAVDGARSSAGRGYYYKPTLKLLEYLGLSRIEDLPEYETALGKIDEFMKIKTEETNESRS